jgi:hypothetical protein
MEYENMLKKLSIKDLKSLIKTYMKEIKITITGKKKKELVQHILNNTEFKNNKITLKSKTFDLPEKQQDDKIKKPSGINRKIFKFVNEIVMKEDPDEIFITDEFIDKKNPSNNINIYKITQGELDAQETDIIINVKDLLLKKKSIDFKIDNTEYNVELRKNSVMRINVKNFIFPEKFIKEFEEEQDKREDRKDRIDQRELRKGRKGKKSKKDDDDDDDDDDIDADDIELLRINLKPNFTILVDIPTTMDTDDDDIDSD